MRCASPSPTLRAFCGLLVCGFLWLLRFLLRLAAQNLHRHGIGRQVGNWGSGRPFFRGLLGSSAGAVALLRGPNVAAILSAIPFLMPASNRSSAAICAFWPAVVPALMAAGVKPRNESS